MSSSEQSVLLIGATGLVGKHLLNLVLASPHFTRVGEYGRRVTSFENETVNPKLVQKVIDFDKLEGSGLKDDAWDIVLITLGTSKKIAGSAEAFTKIDKEYVVNVARQARVQGKKQRLVYLSSIGANATSSFLYMKSKGETEAELASIGYDELIVVRPGMFNNPDRAGTSRENEAGHPYLMAVAGLFMPNIKVQDIAKTILAAGEAGIPGIPSSASPALHPDPTYTIIENKGMLNWAATL